MAEDSAEKFPGIRGKQLGCVLVGRGRNGPPLVKEGGGEGNNAQMQCTFRFNEGVFLKSACWYLFPPAIMQNELTTCCILRMQSKRTFPLPFPQYVCRKYFPFHLVLQRKKREKRRDGSEGWRWKLEGSSVVAPFSLLSRGGGGGGGRGGGCKQKLFLAPPPSQREFHFRGSTVRRGMRLFGDKGKKITGGGREWRKR